MKIKAENNGIQLPVIDGLIAATAQENDLILVTRNTKDFAITGITIHNPWIE
jgi:toxin FitB